MKLTYLITVSILTRGRFISDFNLDGDPASASLPTSTRWLTDNVHDSNLGERDVQESSQILYKVLAKELVNAQGWQAKGHDDGILGNDINGLWTFHDKRQLPAVFVKIVSSRIVVDVRLELVT